MGSKQARNQEKKQVESGMHLNRCDAILFAKKTDCNPVVVPTTQRTQDTTTGCTTDRGPPSTSPKLRRRRITGCPLQVTCCRRTAPVSHWPDSRRKAQPPSIALVSPTDARYDLNGNPIRSFQRWLPCKSKCDKIRSRHRKS